MLAGFKHFQTSGQGDLIGKTVEVTAIKKNFNSALTAEGFERFVSLGEDFDPRKHEALLSTPSADHEPSTVMTELRPGYLHNNEVVRPAQVEIAIAPPTEES